MTVAVAAYRHRKQIIKNTSQLALALGLLDEEDAVVFGENICMQPLQRACVVQQLRSRYRILDAVGGRLHSSTVCMARCGLRAAFVWLCKPQTVEDHVRYHATIVSRCTR